MTKDIILNKTETIQRSVKLEIVKSIIVSHLKDFVQFAEQVRRYMNK